jgi:hypothetical protein
VYVNPLYRGAGFGIRVDAVQPIVVERAMYWADGAAGHSSLGTGAPAMSWFLPEGSTANPYSEWLLLANPNAAPANVEVILMREGGGREALSYTVPKTGRLTLNVNSLAPNVAVSIQVRSSLPIVAERSMYFGVAGGHNSSGIPQ